MEHQEFITLKRHSRQSEIYCPAYIFFNYYFLQEKKNIQQMIMLSQE